MYMHIFRQQLFAHSVNRCYLHYVQMTFYTVSLISIKNKCLYDAIRDLKREKKKVWQKAGLNPGRSRQKAY